VPRSAPTLTAADAGTALCPECQTILVTEYATEPWCERCEWNLDAFTESRSSYNWIGHRIAKLDHSAGYDLSASLYRRLAGHAIDRAGVTVNLIGLVAISGVLLLVPPALIVAGVWLITLLPFFVGWFLGVPMILIAFALWPRFGSVKKALRGADPLTREDAPRLFGLIERIAAASGAPMPQFIAIAPTFNASAGIVGLRRRRTMIIGLPLWLGLAPSERVALLSHELGHYVNGDSARRLAARPALTTFGILADLTMPSIRMVRNRRSVEAAVVGLLQRIAVLPLIVLSNLLLLVHLGINAIGARESQRAEYYADQLAAKVAGTVATMGLLDVFANGKGLITVVGGRARNQELGAGWRAGIAEARERSSDRLPRLRQLTLRDNATIFASHPPAGLRHRMLASLPFQAPAVVLGEDEAAAIDAELIRFEAGYRRVIATTW
jgi:Zn-dependent protease with chaperone function